MSRHLSFRSGNPALNKNSFKETISDVQRGPVTRNELMTIKGTVDKTAFSLLLMIGSGYYVYTEQIVSLILPGCLLALLFTIFKNSMLLLLSQYMPFFKAYF